MAFSWRARDDAHSPEPEGLPWKDYAPPEAEAAERAIEYLQTHSPPEPPDTRNLCSYHESGYCPDPMRCDLLCQAAVDRKPPAIEADPLDEIATLVRLLTYGEMMDLAAALWKMRPEGKEITEQELPGMLHRWSANGKNA